jgi:hypothetical protein
VYTIVGNEMNASSALCLGLRLYLVPWKLETAWSAVLQVENAGGLASSEESDGIVHICSFSVLRSML